MHYLVEASTIDEMLLEMEARLADLEVEIVAGVHNGYWRAELLSLVYKCHGMLRIVREEIRAQIHDPEVGHAAAIPQEGGDRT